MVTTDFHKNQLKLMIRVLENIFITELTATQFHR